MKATLWNVSLGITTCLVLGIAPITVGAQTTWPDFMSTLRAGSSIFPGAATVPPDVNVELPARDVVPEHSKWSGTWSGHACVQRSCDNKLVVERVADEGARIVLAVDGLLLEPISARVEARFVGEELQPRLPDGATIAYRMRRQEAIEMVWRRDTRWVAGILAREGLPGTPTRPLANPFKGLWDLNRATLEDAGTRRGMRANIGENDGIYAPPNRLSEAGRDICRNTRTSVEAIAYTESAITFVADPSKLVRGCEKWTFYLQRVKPGEMIGFPRAGRCGRQDCMDRADHRKKSRRISPSRPLRR